MPTRLPHIARGGTYYRVCGPDWEDPADCEYSKTYGGRWNAPGSFGALHLNENLDGARAYALLFLERQFGASVLPEDITPEYLPDAAEFRVERTNFVDAVTAEGRLALRLSTAYLTADGYDDCRRVGHTAYAANENGVATLSAVSEQSEELAIFDRIVPRIARAGDRHHFSDWWTPL